MQPVFRGVGGVLSVMLLGLWLAAPLPVARAAPPVPLVPLHDHTVYLPLQQGRPRLVTQSRYLVKTAYTTLYNYGCKQREAMTTGQDGVVVLLFGRPLYDPETDAYGVELLDDDFTFASTAQIAQAAKAWVDGFWECQPAPRPKITLAMGTSNDGDPAQVSPAHGRAWARLVDEVDTYVRDHEYDHIIAIKGASNIEINFNGPAVTRAWLDAYAATTLRQLYVVMDCAGCPSINHPDRAPNNGWTLADLAYVSWHTRPAVPLPQIYDPDGEMAAQWQYLAAWIAANQAADMFLAGAFTQAQACVDRDDPCTGTNNTPEQGWQQLATALNNDPTTVQELKYLTDVRWNF